MLVREAIERLVDYDEWYLFRSGQGPEEHNARVGMEDPMWRAMPLGNEFGR